MRSAMVAERLRKVVESHEWKRLADGLGVTISCGVAQRGADEPIRVWLERADRALYRAKNDGRNRVQRASKMGPER